MTAVIELEKKLSVRPKRFRVKEFRKMTEAGILPEESGWEIIDGYLIDKMTIGSKHASIVKKLNKILSVSLGDRAIVSVQDPVQIDDYNEPEPDIALLKPREDFYAGGHPTAKDVVLIIEVSDANITYDREVKTALYADAGFAEVWLVNLKDDTIEQYSELKSGRYHSVKIVEKGDSISSNAIENLSLGVDEILA